ncbi:MAG: MscL family protein, partial [Actinomycetota bacterium]|nr:MscL family protein [Actinomycetota bacterium]
MINAVIVFVITLAVIYFVFVVPMNKLRERAARNAEVTEEDTPVDIALLTEIRDLLKARQEP